MHFGVESAEEKEAILCPLENPAVWERFASGGQRLRLCTPLGPGAPDPDLLLGYSRSYRRCKDGPGGAKRRPWWSAEAKPLPAGGDLPDFQAITVKKDFYFMWGGPLD
jgi:hypothetical protein